MTPAGRPGIARRFPDGDRRCGRSAVWTAWRIGASLLRRRSHLLAVPVVEIGWARVHADLRTPLGLGLYRYGFCPAEARLLPKLLLPGDLVVDGGANIGLLSLIAAGVVGPIGRVLACEPDPGTMALLKANADENRFDTLELHEVALSDRPGRASFTVFEAGSGLASFAPQDARGCQVEVVVTTLDALTANLDRRVTLVKLDIEGAEAKALRGARGLIGRDAPVFLIELEPEHLARQGSSIADVRDALEPHGYEAYAITPAARLAKLTADWRPPDARAPNVVLAPPSRSELLASLTAAPAAGQGSA
ncbi:MAG: FkbM family methyltransferase [Solirubrobacteraceae bacterium]